jgi:peptide/nickel transport system substrate-binding protein
MDEGALMDRQYLYTGDTFTPDYDMFLWGWYLDYDPGSMLSYFTEDQIWNWSDCAWWDPEYEKLYKQQAVELDTAKRVEYVHRMQEILYEQTPYIVTDYGPDFEAWNTAKWEGYIHIPEPKGNVLLPPFGNGCGYANFLSIGPKTEAATEEGGGATTWIIVAVVVVIAVIAVVLILRVRRPKATEE